MNNDRRVALVRKRDGTTALMAVSERWAQHLYAYERQWLTRETRLRHRGILPGRVWERLEQLWTENAEPWGGEGGFWA